MFGERIADSIEFGTPEIEIIYIGLYNISMIHYSESLPGWFLFLASVIALTMAVSLLNNAINGTNSHDWGSS